MSTEATTTRTCDEQGMDDFDCRGTVELWVTETGYRIYRCGAHRAAVIARLEKINRRYPNTPTPPKWFDPLDAGERWNEDDPWP